MSAITLVESSVKLARAPPYGSLLTTYS
eukprot:COSAG02_NODE_62501_length_265_cov_1.614458_1_plen_27_part_10